MSKASDVTNRILRQRMGKRKKEFLDIYAKSLALVASACRKAGITRPTFYRWYNDDADFRDRIDEIRELAKDSVEASIYEQIRKGDTAMIIFYAKTRMKERGYVERTELTGRDGMPLVPTEEVDLSSLTDGQKEVLRSIGNDILNKKE